MIPDSTGAGQPATAESPAFPPPPASPCVSVVIPTYNRAPLLEEALESVRAQTVPVLETIVVDDGSSDDSLSVASRFPGVKVRQTNRLGPAGARDVGVSAAGGEFIAFLDSDDVWLPHKMERQLARFAERPEAGLVYADYAAWDGKDYVGEPVLRAGGLAREGWIYPDLVMGNRVNCSTAVIRTECLRAIGGFVCYPGQKMSLDWPVWLKLARRYPFAYVPEVLAYYRFHAGQFLRNGRTFEHSVKIVLDVIFGDPTLPAELRRKRRLRMGMFRAQVARQHYVEGSFGAATLNALRALWWWPPDPSPLAIAAKAAVKAPLRALGVLPSRSRGS